MSTSTSCEVGISPVLLQAITQTLSSNAQNTAHGSTENEVIVENEMLTEVGNVSEEVVVKCEAQSPHQKYGVMRNEFVPVQEVSYAANPPPGGDINMGSVLSAIAMKLQKKKEEECHQNIPGGIITKLEQHAEEPLHHQMESASMEHPTEHPGTHPPVVFNAEGQTFMVQHQGNTIKIVPHASDSAAPPGGDLNESEMCPVCGDKISGYHYGIFSCESCKGFFKRTVQNKKVFVCHLQSDCDIDIVNRKKCPACRFKKCLNCGMKLEAIRGDRTRGGRSSYAGCSPHNRPKFLRNTAPKPPKPPSVVQQTPPDMEPRLLQLECYENNQSRYVVTLRNTDDVSEGRSDNHPGYITQRLPSTMPNLDPNMDPSMLMEPHTPKMLTDLLSVERIITEDDVPEGGDMSRIPMCCENKMVGDDPDMFSSLLHLADHCLYAIVRWARNLPYFVNVPTDDQILLLQNSWSELLCLSVCWHSVQTPDGQLRLLYGRTLDMQRAKDMGINDIVERLLAFVQHLRRLQVDHYEFVALKVLTLMTPDVSGLKNVGLQHHCQGKLLESLMLHTGTNYRHLPNKVSEMLARLPEIARISQMGRDRLLTRFTPSKLTPFTLLNELIKGDMENQEDDVRTS